MRLLTATIVLLASTQVTVGEILVIPSESTTGVNSSPLEQRKLYLFEVEGTWLRDVPALWRCDAEWFENGNFPADVWSEEYPLQTEPDLLDLQIDYTSPNWLGTTDGQTFLAHTYSPSHRYRTYYAGQGNPVNFRMSDDYWTRNSGTLTVTITEATDVPATSTWGLLASTLGIAVVGSMLFLRKQAQPASS